MPTATGNTTTTTTTNNNNNEVVAAEQMSAFSPPTSSDGSDSSSATDPSTNGNHSQIIQIQYDRLESEDGEAYSICFVEGVQVHEWFYNWLLHSVARFTPFFRGNQDIPAVARFGSITREERAELEAASPHIGPPGETPDQCLARL